MSDQNQLPTEERKEPTVSGAQPTRATDASTADATATASRAPAGGVSLVTVVVVSALLAAFSGVLSWQFSIANKQQAPQFVTLDAAKLVAMQAKTSLSQPGMTAEQAAKEGQQFVQRLNQTLDEYTQAGIPVLNASVVLNSPGQSDITAQVAQKLGLKME
ncbi:TrbI F-type domain-containing protein (plasmid) [Burkholderia vietnamiensis]|uniref:Uncharacterized protein n=1 Tax=Burkholderia vietnamiensis (strain G4 / LMG 22486) TaxID=269482 RepID=A4JTN8_BURVG|nr:hypothetical protein Bcep1808_6753 [Burkholderia vietnamiensis G4]MCB4350199.1 TrbI F-type domain-containing protein [Burkholderia vietnamiensis]